jgi:PIN domain nuclease of toxin-antitoxin system
MDYLLDTHVLIWYLYNSKKLSRAANKILDDNNIEKFVSMASFYELSVKQATGKLDFEFDNLEFHQILESGGIKLLNFDLVSLNILSKLPLLHGDPFDRMIVATALSYDLTVLTADKKIHDYAVPCEW